MEDWKEKKKTPFISQTEQNNAQTFSLPQINDLINLSSVRCSSHQYAHLLSSIRVRREKGDRRRSKGKMRMSLN